MPAARSGLRWGPAPLVLLLAAAPAGAHLALGAELLVEADAVVIDVPGYSVPSLVEWNGDALPDLIVGEGGGGFPDGKIRVYPNVGTAAAPAFGEFSWVQSQGADLVQPGSG